MDAQPSDTLVIGDSDGLVLRLRREGVGRVRREDSLGPTTLVNANCLVFARPPTSDEQQLLSGRPATVPLVLTCLTELQQDISGIVIHAPRELFRPAHLALGTAIVDRQEKLEWVEWQARLSRNDATVTDWLEQCSTLLVRWFGSFDSVITEADEVDHFACHLKTTNGAGVALNAQCGEGPESAMGSHVVLHFRGEMWTLQLGAGADRLTVDSNGSSREVSVSGNWEGYCAKFISAVLDGRGRPFFTADHVSARSALLATLRGSAAGRSKRLAAVGEVVLVKPPRTRRHDDVIMLPPLGLARLQAWLGGVGLSPRIVDLDTGDGEQTERLRPFEDDERVEGWLGGAPDRELDATVDGWIEEMGVSEKTTLVGFSVVDVFLRVQANIVLCLCRRLKQALPRVATVVGGDFQAINPDLLLAAGSPVDSIVYGDGEEATVHLALAAAFGDRRPDAVTGVCRGGDRLQRPPKRAQTAFARRPTPDFSGVPFERYRRPPSPALRALLHQRKPALTTYNDRICLLPYAFVGGCSGKCVFCSWGNFIDIQDPAKSAREMVELSERYETDCFYLLNTTLNISRRMVDQFVDALLRSNRRLHWTDSARPHLVDDDLARGLREAGCVMLSYGVESGSDAVLARMKKGFTADQAAASLQAAHRAGILNRVNLIAGFFHERDEDVQATVDFIAHNHEAIDIIGCFQGFYLFPGMAVNEEEIGVRLLPERDRLPRGQTTMSYDEVGGLCWEEKKVQIEGSYLEVRKALTAAGVYCSDKIDDYDLFHLARLFDDVATRKALLIASMASPLRRSPASDHAEPPIGTGSRP